MNQFENELLTKSYEQYAKTGNSNFNFVMHNSNELFYYTEAAKNLDEDGYIEAISDNIFEDTIVVSEPSNLILTFNILQKGIDYVKHSN